MPSRTTKAGLSAVREKQLEEARKAAVIARRRKQLERKEREVRELRQWFADAGLFLQWKDAELKFTPPPAEKATTAARACSAAGIALRQCAEARART